MERLKLEARLLTPDFFKILKKSSSADEYLYLTKNRVEYKKKLCYRVS
jgi:hypothetical protein